MDDDLAYRGCRVKLMSPSISDSSVETGLTAVEPPEEAVLWAESWE